MNPLGRSYLNKYYEIHLNKYQNTHICQKLSYTRAVVLQVFIGNIIQNPGNAEYNDEEEFRVNGQNGDKEGINVVVVVLAAVLAVVSTGVLIIGQLSEIPANASVYIRVSSVSNV